MFCKYCGAQIDDDSKFCPKCGGQIFETPQNSRQKEPVHQYRTATFYEAEHSSNSGCYITIFILCVLVAIFIWFSGYGFSSKSSNRMINCIKKAQALEGNTLTYGEAFDLYFEETNWKYFESTEGDDIVEFEGKSKLRGEYLRIQFQLDIEKGRFDIVYFNSGGVTYNEEGQALILTAIFYSLGAA